MSRQPSNVDFLMVWSHVERRLGEFSSAIDHLERAVQLSPRSMSPLVELAMTLTYTREYARADEDYDRAILLAPDVEFPYSWRAWNLALWRGWEAAGQIALPQPYDPDWPSIWPYWLSLYRGDFDAALSLAQSLPPEGVALPDYVNPRSMLEALVYETRGEPELAARAWQATVAYLEAKLEDGPTDARFESALGMAYAGLGMRQPAILHGNRGVELMPISKDAVAGTRNLHQLAEIHARLGDNEEALLLLDRVLSMPSLVSITRINAEPVFASVRQHPGYRRLAAIHG